MPTTLPKAITPDSGSKPAPEGTTEIQIGFGYGLNYPFVVQNTKAAAQIFQLLPEALEYGGDVDAQLVVMRKLIPLNTLRSLGYVTTLAIVTWPTDLVDALRLNVTIPTSKLYHHPWSLVRNLTEQINPAISIISGSVAGDGPSSNDPGLQGGGGGGTVGTGSDPFNNNASNAPQSASQKGVTAGIVVASFGVAAAYGAAMFVIARRYKRKKQTHRRASSMSNPSTADVAQVSTPAMMGGALLSQDFSHYGAVTSPGPQDRDSHGSGPSGMGGSGRTAFISAPMAAENSLGWN